jgi:hypothetical protein
MTVRHYSSAAGKMILQLGVTAVATAMQVDTTAGLPGATPFSLLVDVGLPTEEIVTVNQVSGNTLVVVRGEDGTSAQAHAAGAVVRHAITARDLRDSRDHENASAGVHGITGSVVGTTDTQALTNKNLTSGSNTFPATLATAANLTAHTAATAAHGATGAVVGTTNAQTLTNKTINGASNTLVVPTSQVTGLDATLLDHGTRITANEGDIAGIQSNLGSQTTFAATSATKNSKRIHWGTASITSNGSAVATITHGAGFTPTVVLANPTQGYQMQVNSIGATTFQVVLLQADGTLYPNQPATIHYFCGE